MMKMKIYKIRVELESSVFCPKEEQTFFSEFSYNTDFLNHLLSIAMTQKIIEKLIQSQKWTFEIMEKKKPEDTLDKIELSHPNSYPQE